MVASLSHLFGASVLLFSTVWCALATPQLLPRNSTGLRNAVTWDEHSLFINGVRTFILSAEYHPWRLPNPNLWSDVFQKIKANGFNTVSFYVDWAVHFPTPDTNGGAGDWQAGTYRDLQRFIDDAKDAGLWLIARPGPYINAETSGGGFPGWLGNIEGALRTDAEDYHQAWVPYLTAVSKIIAKNQVTNGGPIILVQAENEFSEGSTRSPYMQQVIDLHRANGVVVPIIHNDQHGGTTGNFSPDQPGEGDVNIYCGDSYPQGTTRWNQVQPYSYYYGGHKAVAPSNPLCLAEFGGGWLQGWQGTTRGGTGYERFTYDLTGPNYEDIFYKENYAQTATILNIYMLFGGTNWGHTYEPTVYSSYDYGAGINENRIATQKMNEMRTQGYFLRVSPDLLASNFNGNGTNYTTNSLLYAVELRNPDTGAAFYFVRHSDSTSTAVTSGQLSVNTLEGVFTVPQNGSLTISGREYKILPTDYIFGSQKTKIIYTTAEILTWTTMDSTDFLILYAPKGETGETVFSFASAPRVDLSSAPGASSRFANSTLRLNYVLNGLGVIKFNHGQKQTVIILMDKDAAFTWSAPVLAGSGPFGSHFGVGTNATVFVGGPYLVRTATTSGGTLKLTGDNNGTTSIEFFAPSAVSRLSWNSKSVPVSRTPYGSYKGTLGTVKTVTPPSLGSWKVIGSLPEVEPGFDDSSFITCSQTATNYTLAPLAGDKVLYSQQYGIYGGNLIWRGHFNASGQEQAVNLTVQSGFGHGYSTWLNGVFLGSSQGNSTVSLTTDIWNIPNGTLRIGQDNVLTVLQDHMGIVETSTNSGKEPRGIRGYSIIGGNTTFNTWKLQGNQGGAAGTPDTFRGYMNEGGLYAERIGAHLPGFPDAAWAAGSPLAISGGGLSGPGVNFYRTQFNLNLPSHTDVPIRLSIAPSDITSNFRVQIYLNGWMLGKYINNFGPQTDFVLPAGILLPNAENTLAISLWSLDSAGASLAGLSLISDGTFATSLGSEIADWTAAPNYAAQKSKRPSPTYVKPL